MDFGSDERAVSEIMGSILVFGLLLLLLVLAQVTLVPVWNQQIEYEHSLRAQDDMGDLQSGISQVAASGSSLRTPIEAGVSYPSRPLLLNPPPVQGTVTTTERRDVSLANVLAAGNPETRDFWNGQDRSFQTRSIRYHAQYNEYRNAGTVLLENGVMYKDFGDATTVTGSQNDLISGNRITLVAVDGAFSDASGSTTSVGLNPVSAPSQSVAVTNESGERIEITVRTRLPRDRWEQVLADEMTPQGNVVEIGWVDDTPYNRLTLFLRPNVTYDLRMAKVGVGTRDVREESAAYITADPTANQNVPTSGGNVVVEVRDRFNNPVSGTEVTFTVTAGQGSFDVPTVISDERGRAVASLTTTGLGEVTITASSDLNDDDTIQDHERVGFTTQVGPTVISSGQGQAFSDINPAGPGSVQFLEASWPAPCQQGCTVSVTMQNNNALDMRPVSVRVNTFSGAAPGASGGDAVTKVVIYDEGESQVDGTELTIGGDYEGVDLDTISGKSPGDPAATEAYEVVFVQNDGDLHTMENDEFFVLTVIYENQQSGEFYKGVYLISPKSV